MLCCVVRGCLDVPLHIDRRYGRDVQVQKKEMLKCRRGSVGYGTVVVRKIEGAECNAAAGNRKSVVEFAVDTIGKK